MIYKPHPKEASTQIIENPNIEGLVYIDNIPIEELINISDVVISITSAVDYSVCFFNKPLVQMGKNSLNISGCSYVVDEVGNLESQMAKALEEGLTNTQKKCHEQHLMELCDTVLWDDMTERDLRYGISNENDIF